MGSVIGVIQGDTRSLEYGSKIAVCVGANAYANYHMSSVFGVAEPGL